MIRFQNQVPSVYPSASRDFQYLCWLIDIVLNSVKHNVDDLYDLPNSKSESKLIELLAMTLGFKVRRNYERNQLRALVAVLPQILKYKGTKLAVDMAGRALIAASGAIGNYSSSVKNGELEVRFPETLVDISLFTDLLPYILPAGMTCRILRTNVIEAAYDIELDCLDNILAEWIPDFEWDQGRQNSIGLATLFNVGSDISTFANYQNLAPTGDGRTLPERLNSGLLDNSIIPALIETQADGKNKEITNEK
jgi:hypothetical protein